jgi:hypothetical protein
MLAEHLFSQLMWRWSLFKYLSMCVIAGFEGVASSPTRQSHVNLWLHPDESTATRYLIITIISLLCIFWVSFNLFSCWHGNDFSGFTLATKQRAESFLKSKTACRFDGDNPGVSLASDVHLKIANTLGRNNGGNNLNLCVVYGIRVTLTPSVKVVIGFVLRNLFALDPCLEQIHSSVGCDGRQHAEKSCWHFVCSAWACHMLPSKGRGYTHFIWVLNLWILLKFFRYSYSTHAFYNALFFLA